MTPALGPASLLPSALTALPTAAMVAVLCAAVIGEIVLVPAVLPGATIALLTGALIGAGRPALAVAVPLAAAVVAGDQLAYVSGAAVTGWWRRRRPGRRPRPVRQGRVESWFAAALPSLAGAAGLRYRQFAPRVLVLRVPWLAATLGTGALAASSLAHLGHVIGLAGVIATALVASGLLVLRRRAADRGTSDLPRT
jgi:membrane protein DedA with SNARE-associated domain